MNTKNKNLIDSELRVKSTAALRQQIIKELTQPDKSLGSLLEQEKDDSNIEQYVASTGEAES